MPRLVLIPWAICFVILLSATVAEDSGASKTTKKNTISVTEPTTTTNVVTVVNATCGQNDTNCNKEEETTFFTLSQKIYQNKEMLVRAFYVLISVTGVVVLYFVIKTVMLRRRNNKTRKYGIVSSPESNLEMQPLDQGDDDDDMTLYEARSTRLK